MGRREVDEGERGGWGKKDVEVKGRKRMEGRRSREEEDGGREDGGRKRMEGGRGWREEEDGGRKRMEGGRGWREEEDGGRKRMEGGRGWREGLVVSGVNTRRKLRVRRGKVWREVEREKRKRNVKKGGKTGE
ncbi:hypothetical protein Pmani_035711 [Petrolisthes manimaculis]|uniref:Uncharacterized protein n=1 Tax=Petrolisthes manimaculis TaxID=1843537 RepID=A0AAE1NL79_9EUCA|nr:hypothetical protein Pmani_035711 [Petrolisthes manimaculis]